MAVDLAALTVADWRAGISRALQAHHIPAVYDLLRGMAAHHPAEAEELRLLMLAALGGDE